MPPMKNDAEKTPHAVAVFATTSDAMAVQAAFEAGKVPGRMIPIPAQISAGCGLAWCVPADQEEELREALAREQLRFEAIHVVDLR